jgi:hypothetical protein
VVFGCVGAGLGASTPPGVIGACAQTDEPSEAANTAPTSSRFIVLLPLMWTETLCGLASTQIDKQSQDYDAWLIGGCARPSILAAAVLKRRGPIHSKSPTYGRPLAPWLGRPFLLQRKRTGSITNPVLGRVVASAWKPDAR